MLIDKILNIQYDASWGIWAELVDGKLVPESRARYGQRVFENGGMLDDFVFVCDGEDAGDHLAAWRDDNDELIDGWIDEFIDPINVALEWS
jgi:hypothetical protein